MHNIYKQKYYINNILDKSYILFNYSAKDIENYKQFVNKNSFCTLLNTVIDFDKFFIYIYTNKSNNV